MTVALLLLGLLVGAGLLLWLHDLSLIHISAPTRPY